MLLISTSPKFCSLVESFKSVNSLPSHKILDLSKLKAFTDNKINLNEKLKLVFGREENTLEKGQNTGYKHFSFSYNVFKGLSCRCC